MGKLSEILSRILGIDESEINDNTSPDNVESWDSFNGLMIVSELESAYSVSFTTAEITGVNSVADIRQRLRNRGLDADE